MKKILAMLLSMMLILSMTSVVVAEEEPVKLDFFVVNPWVTSELPDPAIDIYKAFFAEKFGVDVTLYNPAEGKTELLTRMTAGNAPDLIAFSNFQAMWEFYEQGVLIEDWNAYADQIADYLTAMGEAQVDYYTRDGKLTALAPTPGEQFFGWMIRKDWLNNLGLSMPTNLDELYDVLYAFTYNDPDGNGVDDTYGITSAGGGKGIGELTNLLGLFGEVDWYIDENGEVVNPVTQDYYEEFLAFLKKLYDNGILDPNWYTQGWDERKAQLFAGSFGMCWYPPLALYEEQYSATNQSEAAADWWTVMPMFQGKLPAMTITGAITLSVSAQAAADEAKMAKICEIINTMQPANDEYYMIAHGVDFDGYRMKVLDNGTKYIYRDYEEWPDTAFADGGRMRASGEGNYIATAVYAQMWRATSADGVLSGATPDPDEYFIAKTTEKATIDAQPRYAPTAKYLNLDAAVVEEANLVQNEFVLNYILGEDNDFAAFVENWKIAGGEDLQAQAVEQLTDWGFLK